MSLDKIWSTYREIRSVFSENELSTLTLRKFYSLLSKLNSFSGAVMSTLLHLLPFHHIMRQQLVQATYKNLTHLNLTVIEEMQWWHNEIHRWSGEAMISNKML